MLWRENLTSVHVSDIRHHIGWVDAGLAAAIILQARLVPERASPLIDTIGVVEAT